MPLAIAITFFSAPASSTPITSRLPYTRNREVLNTDWVSRTALSSVEAAATARRLALVDLQREAGPGKDRHPGARQALRRAPARSVGASPAPAPWSRSRTAPRAAPPPLPAPPPSAPRGSGRRRAPRRLPSTAARGSPSPPAMAPGDSRAGRRVFSWRRLMRLDHFGLVGPEPDRCRPCAPAGRRGSSPSSRRPAPRWSS